MLRIISFVLLLTFSITNYAETVPQDLEDIYLKYANAANLGLMDKYKLLKDLDARLKHIVDGSNITSGDSKLQFDGPKDSYFIDKRKLYDDLYHLREDIIVQGLNKLYIEHGETVRLDSAKKAGALIDMDQRLRFLLYKSFGTDQASLSPSIWEAAQQKYRELGLQQGGFDGGQIEYDEKLLKEAKAADTNSSYEAYTSYLEIEDCINCHPYGGHAPNFDAALAYEKKYPEGPFIAEVLEVLALHQGGLYGVISRKIESERSARNKKASVEEEYSESNPDLDEWVCFLRYITKEPLAVQKERARKQAIAYYSQLARLHPEVSYKDSISELNLGQIPSGYVCATID